MKIWTIAAAITLTSCATYEQDRALIDTTVASLIGQPLEAATARLGVPVESTAVGAAHAYIWRRDNIYIDNSGDALKCEIRLLVDAENVVTSGEHQGNNYACSLMAERLR